MLMYWKESDSCILFTNLPVSLHTSVKNSITPRLVLLKSRIFMANLDQLCMAKGRVSMENLFLLHSYY